MPNDPVTPPENFPGFGPALSRRDLLRWASAVGLAGVLHSATARGDEPAADPARPDAAPPVDSRLGALKDLDGYFPFEPYDSVEEWQERAEFLRRQVLVACGLWPMPDKPALHPTIHGKVERDGYTVERVSFETSPGLYVTGSLYRPVGKEGKRPTIISPHGHWDKGRFYDAGEAGVKKEIESGAERYEVGGRYPLQARCVQLARMGCVVFLYDMLGYADNETLGFELIHRFAKQRPELSQPDTWGLFSAQSELRCINALGLQTWNSIRVVDFVLGLPDVDPDRIGVTGASGGGTQTFILGCVDDRPAAFFPAVMVSTAMQGGCTCENATYLRVETGNIELAAMIAPRPLGMTGAKDWTEQIETKGLPQLKEHYKRLGVADRVEGKFFPFPHNYNAPSRAMMYDFFNRHFKIGAADLREQDYVPLTVEEATVWTAEHPKPAGGPDAEQKVLKAIDQANLKQFARLIPTDRPSLEKFRETVGGGWQAIIGRQITKPTRSEPKFLSESTQDGVGVKRVLVRDDASGEEVSFVWLQQGEPKNVALWIDPRGSSSLWRDGALTAPVRELLAGGCHVFGIDLFGQNPDRGGDVDWVKSRVVNNPREFAGYTYGYNHPLFVQRVHDLLRFLNAYEKDKTPFEKLYVYGAGQAGLYAAAAVAHSPQLVTKVAVGTKKYRFASITDIRDPWLVPGAVKYGDVPGLLALCAPLPLWVAGEGAHLPDPIEAAYRAAGVPDKVTTYNGPPRDEAASAVKWLLSDK